MASFVQAIGVHNKVSDMTSVTHIVAYLYQHRFTPKHGEVSPTTCKGGEGGAGRGTALALYVLGLQCIRVATFSIAAWIWPLAVASFKSTIVQCTFVYLECTLKYL